MLHFDVNKTVILTDSVHNWSIEKTIEKLLLNSVWGRISGDHIKKEWTLISEHFTSIKPVKDDREIINFWQFTKIFHSGDNNIAKSKRQEMR